MDLEHLVVAEVIDDVRKSFIESGIDQQTLDKLEKLWISKLKNIEDGEQKLMSTCHSNPEESGNATVMDPNNSFNTKDTIPQVDGGSYSSEEDDDGDVDDDDDEPEEDEDEDSDSDLDPDGESYDGGIEMDPPGSDDDISDEEANELFDTENVVVCQYDKISRARNKWKLQLKDGVMNINGRDYVFQKAHGEVDW